MVVNQVSLKMEQERIRNLINALSKLPQYSTAEGK
jgi:hypothetical protein